MALKYLPLILALSCLAVIANADGNNYSGIKPGHNLIARLEGGTGVTECWNALMEIKSCSNEIIIFFLNGQADLGLECCHAIDIITTNCWPSMLASLGFTAEEGNILRGYCDASLSAPPLA